MQLKPGHAKSIHTTGRMGRTAHRAGVAALIGGSVLALGMLVHPATATAATGHIVAAPECGTQHGLSDPTNSNHKALVSYWFDINSGGTHTEVCTLTGNVKAGDIVTANFVPAVGDTESAPTAAEITLVSNNAPAPTPRNQTLFDCASFGDAAGAGDPCATSTTPSLTVTIPACGFQVDLIYGEPITPLVQGTYLKNHVFVNGGEGKAGACTTPGITTVASAGGTIGKALTDSATVTGVTSPTGNVVFRLFGANDSTCAGAAIATDSEPISGSGTASTTQTIKPTTAGTFQWTATYTGITPNLVSTCGSEPVTMTASGGSSGGNGGVKGITSPSTGAGIPLPLGAGLIAAGLFVLAGESRLRRRLS